MASVTMVWSQQQQACFDWVQMGQGSVVVEAVAGAGKTTTLVEMVRRMRGSVNLLAFNAKMGKELKTRTADLRNVHAGTFHSFGLRALSRVLGKFEVEEKKSLRIVQEMLEDTDEDEIEGLKPAVVQLVGLAKQMGFLVRGMVESPTARHWEGLVEKHDIMERLPEDVTIGQVTRLSAQVLRASCEDLRTIDFDDMVYLPLLRQLRFYPADWVLIDEAQDTNPTRREFARRMLSPTGRLVAVGDPRQAIFGFTGADHDSLDRIRETFSAGTLRLSVTYRCPKTVVRLAREHVQHIEAAPTAPDGRHLEIEYDELASVVEPGDAILCRFNRYLVSTCFRLIRAGKPAKIEGRAIGEGLAALAGRWKARTLDVLETRLATYFEREIGKAKAKDNDARVEALADQQATMEVLVARGRELKITSVAALQEMIRGMFDDVGASQRLVVLSSVHRSKGLEWERVFILGRRQMMPARSAKQDWQQLQEANLIYVALTRAQGTLVDVHMPPED